MTNPISPLDASFESATKQAEKPEPDWQILANPGPVFATAIHDGHSIRDSLRRHLAISDEDRLREEDPLTGLLIAAGDTTLRMRTSRFEFDVNRPRDKAISTNPADTWGLKIWRDETLPSIEIQNSLDRYNLFYQMISQLLDQQLEQWGSLLVLDIHSYNHRRAGSSAPPAAQAENPDIDLGVTTLDADRWGEVARKFGEALSEADVGGRRPDVRSNVRYPSGGFFPEWIYARYGKDICTISIEYKKIFMDEWTGKADIAIVDDLRRGLEIAVAWVRSNFGQGR